MKPFLFAAAVFCAISNLTAAQAKTLVYCSEASPEGFDPARYTAGSTFDASSKTIYNRLIEYKRGATEIVPALAERWDVSDDGKVYTFHLRPGVKFQSNDAFTPSRNLNADDVIFSFARQSGDQDFAKYGTDSIWSYYNDVGIPHTVEKIEKLDDLTVRFVLKQPSAPFLGLLGLDFASILSKEYADQLLALQKTSDLNQKPIGTGPFRFVAYQQDAAIRYEAFADYWGGKQPVDNLVFAITTDPAIRIQKLKAGECQIAVYPSPADIPALKEDKNVKVLQLPGLNVGYLAFNTTEKPFNKPEVRRAISQAVNKKTILNAVYQGNGIIADSVLPPDMFGFNKALKPIAYDPESARQKIKELGWEGQTITLWAMPVSRPYNPNGKRAAELLQADLTAIGLKPEIISFEWGEYLKRSNDPAHKGAVLARWTADNGDPDSFLTPLLTCDSVGGNNKAVWCNREFDKLVEEARNTNVDTRRNELYQQAQQIAADEAPWIPLANGLISVITATNVIGYQIEPSDAHRFDGVDITD
ncbi:ABC transporter substrate-binding protein [Brucella pseudogrignonensis]|uniref:ABC transporter substrate-binding protein n=1 Tax=Brucella pseudogrignonensis TaxID=419475 RepID=UPI001E5C5AD1|nr:ABC transporter substrate-binding protein [Brucella pseudogrignonensis]MCD4512066.1 ABC transporter substrate-binding protein [Brucella pseudogrignonensis]